MPEVQEITHVVIKLRTNEEKTFVGAAKVFDDRKDARAYAKSMNARSMYYSYKVFSCKKG